MYEKKKKRKVSMKTPMELSERNWECEEDLRAIARSEACKGDPERMKKVKALAATKLEENKRRKEEAQNMIDLGQEA